MRRFGRVSVLVAVLLGCAAAPWAILFSTLAASPAPERAFRPDRCTRACHDHGCRHRPVLPAALASDEGLFGLAVRALHAGGRATGLGPGRGYGAVNLLVFCLLWPGLMLALVGVVAWQGLALRAARRVPRSP